MSIDTDHPLAEIVNRSRFLFRFLCHRIHLLGKSNRKQHLEPSCGRPVYCSNGSDGVSPARRQSGQRPT